MRPEVFRGHASSLCGDPTHSRVLGYINRGGTLNEAGMLFANQCTWAHALYQGAHLLGHRPGIFLSNEEIAAVEGHGAPDILLA